ncbi:uncharacterized protein LOC131650123 [Vicia villosa]|uniref:uncharacterized protein LOC131650123 n=1 Tax=Vicia villosa TaxID=3911 RepID=UPI00273B0A7D|nr:uncharacterized protein LOC131650123 [Vicia villosa]
MKNQTGGGWQEVRRKGRSANFSSRWDILRNSTEGSKGVITSFFITNFDNRWRARDLFFEFKDLGVVDEIVIPPKKDWRGEKYGFMRFAEVENVGLLEVKLDNLWLEGRKLKANVSKFKRKDLKEDNLEKRKVFSKGNVVGNEEGLTKGFQKEAGRYGFSRRAGGVDEHNKQFRSYADTVINKPLQFNNHKGINLKLSNQNLKTGEASNKEEETFKTFIYSSSLEEQNKYRKAMVGIARSPGMAFGVSKSLLAEGIFTVVATPLGPNLCLLEETVDGDLDRLLSEAWVWKDRWFKEVRKWQKKDVECFRSVWVSIFGIPCFVRNRRFCELLLSDIGVVANGEILEEQQLRMDVTNLMIFTDKLDTINLKIAVFIDGETFHCLVKEDATVRVGDMDGSTVASEDDEWSEPESCSEVRVKVDRTARCEKQVDFPAPVGGEGNGAIDGDPSVCVRSGERRCSEKQHVKVDVKGVKDVSHKRNDLELEGGLQSRS